MNIEHINRAAIAIAEKHNLDTEEACSIMNKKIIWLISNEEIKTSYSSQLSYLTMINIAQRVFLGGVKCVLPLNTPNLLPIQSESFNNLVKRYGGIISNIDSDNKKNKDDVKILFGFECYDEKCIELVGDGWRGGVNFYMQERIKLSSKNSKVSLGPVAAAAIACYFAFNLTYKIIDYEIELNTGISLWKLNSGKDWYKEENEGPHELNLPRNTWILGLGHLGQAYVWTLGLMPFKEPQKSLFLLQDADVINLENIGSQVLSFKDDVGKPKTRPCSDFLESMGFRTQIVEKPFNEGDSGQQWMKNFPILLSGVDNIKTRKSITYENLELFFDGATNGALSLFDSFTMKNIFKINKNTQDLWPDITNNDKILHKNLYEKYEKEYTCGILTNINISTPFVGMFGATIVISELIRSLNKGTSYSIVSLQIRNLSNLDVIENGFYGNDFLRLAI